MATTGYAVLASDLGEATTFDTDNDYVIVETGGVLKKIKAATFWLAAELANQYSPANFTDITHPINVTNKFLGKMSFDTSNQIWVYAAGADPDDTWNKVSDDSVLHTPI